LTNASSDRPRRRCRRVPLRLSTADGVHGLGDAVRSLRRIGGSATSPAASCATCGSEEAAMLEQAVTHDRRQQTWRAAGGKHYEFLKVLLEAVAAFSLRLLTALFQQPQPQPRPLAAPRPRHSLCSKDISAIATSRLSIANGSDVLSSVASCQGDETAAAPHQLQTEIVPWGEYPRDTRRRHATVQDHRP
jgi:hypothetical protein